MSVIDRNTFDALRETTGDDFVRELVATFLEEAPSMLADLTDALAKNEPDRFRRAAHSLKSNGNTFGALALAGKARELEMRGLAADAAADEAAIAEIDAAYADAAAELKSLSHG